MHPFLGQHLHTDLLVTRGKRRGRGREQGKEREGGREGGREGERERGGERRGEREEECRQDWRECVREEANVMSGWLKSEVPEKPNYPQNKENKSSVKM